MMAEYENSGQPIGWDKILIGTVLAKALLERSKNLSKELAAGNAIGALINRLSPL